MATASTSTPTPTGTAAIPTPWEETFPTGNASPARREEETNGTGPGLGGTADRSGGYNRRYGGRNGFGYNSAQRMVFDGKRMRKAIQRRTVDFNCSIGKYVQVENEIASAEFKFAWLFVTIAFLNFRLRL